MKILAMSLLRLGDFLQVAPVIHGLAGKYPGAQIDLLTFKPVKALHPMMPTITRWWTIDRDELQAGLGRADIPLLTSYDVLKEQLEAISAENYDLMLNLTHTQFSGWIAGFVNAQEKLGLSFDRRGQPQFHSPWLRFLDERAQVKSADIFNYTDIYSQACELGAPDKHWPLEPTMAGHRQVEALGLMKQETLVCQLFTSDDKKNWGEGAWVRFLKEWRALRSSSQIVLLGSPQEESRVNEIARRADVGAKSAILSLDGALALLKRADVLVTGDTSIKHLANASDARVLELSLGPSDYLRTGVYKPGSLILQPRTACAPCPHSGACTQPSHVCAQQLDPSMVARAADGLMKDDWKSLSRLAGETASVSFLRTQHLETGFWFACEISSVQPLKTVDAILERCTWKFLLNQEFKRPLVEFGSETVRLETEIERLIPVEQRQPLLAHLDFLEKEEARREAGARLSKDSFAREWAGQAVDLSRARRAQSRIEMDVRQAEIKVKLIRSLKTRLMEKA